MTDSNPLDSLSDRYKVLKLLGEGGMGRVYKARDLSLDRTVAIKVLFGQFAEKNVPRFQREAQTMSSLKHANLVEVYDFGITDGGDAFLVMENVTGQTLSSIIERRSPMKVSDVLKLCKSIAAGMAHAHSKKVVHRDLKPSNVLVMNPDDLSEMKILDFGISKALESESGLAFRTMTGQLIGTPLYMSPEQAEGLSSIDERADQYSLGCIMYQCLSGKLPFSGNTALDTIQMHCQEAPPPLNPSLEIPPRVEAVVMRLLEKKPDDRFASMVELIQEVDAITMDMQSEIAEPVPASEEAIKSAESRPKSFVEQWQTTFISLSVILLVCIGLASYYISTTSSTKIPSAQPIVGPSWQAYFEPTREENRIIPGSYSDKVRMSETDGNIDRKPVLTAMHFRKLPIDQVCHIRIERSSLHPDCFEALAKFPKLEYLMLDRTCENSNDLGLLSMVTGIRDLDIEKMRVRASTIREWQPLQKLEILVLNTCSIEDDILPAIVETFPDLESLDLSYCEGFNRPMLQNLSGLKKLKYLALDQINITDETLVRLSGNNALEALNLKNNPLITPKGIERVLMQNPKLIRLTVGGCPHIFDAVMKNVNAKVGRDVIYPEISKQPTLNSNSFDPKNLKKRLDGIDEIF